MSKRNVKFASDGASTAPNEYSYWLKLLFRSVCGLLAMTTVLKELRRYMDNNDKPVISFRKFNVAPFVGKNPTYTICFEELAASNGKFLLYQEDYLLDNFGLQKSVYEALLSGGVTETNKTNNYHEIQFEKATKGPKQLLERYKLTSGDGTLWFHSKDGYMRCDDDLKGCPFSRTYQDSKRICLTRNDMAEDYPGISRAHEELEIRNDGKLKILVYIHYPNQGMRNFFKRFSKNKKFGASMKSNFNKITFLLSGVTIVRNRIEGNNPCYQDNKDDERIYESAAKWMLDKHWIGCLPPFWKIFLSAEKFKDDQYCKLISNSNQTKAIFEAIEMARIVENSTMYKPRDEIVESFDPPCDVMSYGYSIKRSSVMMEKKDLGEKYNPKNAPFLLHFKHSDEHYMEMKNERDFNMGMLWAHGGGYIGLFLGYSLAQAPYVFAIGYRAWKDNKIIKKGY